MTSLNSKAQGLSINVIILAALAIIILVVLTVMVVNKTSSYGTTLKNVSETNCAPLGEPKSIGTINCQIIAGNFRDLNPGEVCCKKT